MDLKKLKALRAKWDKEIAKPKTALVEPFKWRTTQGTFTPPAEMTTGHLYNVLKMVWNNRTNHPPVGVAKIYEFGPHYTDVYLKQAIKELYTVLSTRDITPLQRQGLSHMQKCSGFEPLRELDTMKQKKSRNEKLWVNKKYFYVVEAKFNTLSERYTYLCPHNIPLEAGDLVWVKTKEGYQQVHVMRTRDFLEADKNAKWDLQLIVSIGDKPVDDTLYLKIEKQL